MNPNQKEKKKELIPKLIFQTNKMKWEDIPDSQKKAIQSHIDLNPDYKYRYFDQEQVIELIRENFGDEAEEVEQTYLCFKPGSFKGDVFRVIVLYLFGGVYFDVDMVSLKPMDQVIDRENFSFVISRTEGDKRGYSGGFLASKPKHPILRIYLDILKYHCKNKFIPYVFEELVKNKQSYNHFLGLSITGPYLLHKVVHNYLHIPEDATGLKESDKKFGIQVFQYCWTTNVYTKIIGNCDKKLGFLQPEFEGFHEEMEKKFGIKDWNLFTEKKDFYY